MIKKFNNVFKQVVNQTKHPDFPQLNSLFRRNVEHYRQVDVPAFH
jgi:hypothetical protein